MNIGGYKNEKNKTKKMGEILNAIYHWFNSNTKFAKFNEGNSHNKWL